MKKNSSSRFYVHFHFIPLAHIFEEYFSIWFSFFLLLVLKYKELCNFTQWSIHFASVLCVNLMILQLFSFFWWFFVVIVASFIHHSVQSIGLKYVLGGASSHIHGNILKNSNGEKNVKFAFNQSSFIAYIRFTWNYTGLFHCTRNANPDQIYHIMTKFIYVHKQLCCKQ